MKHAAKKSHESNRTGYFDGDENEADSTELQNVTEKKARTEQNDSGFEPELVCGDARAKNLRYSNRVRNRQTEDNRPKNVFDVRKSPVMRSGVRADVLLQQFPGVTYRRKQQHARDDAEESEGRLHWFDLWNYDGICHFRFSVQSSENQQLRLIGSQ
jgi:hypothetical protein